MRDLKKSLGVALGLASEGTVNEVSLVAAGRQIALTDNIDVLQLKDGDVVFAVVEGDPRFTQVEIDVDLGRTRVTFAVAATVSLEAFKLKLQQHDSSFRAVSTQLLSDGSQITAAKWTADVRRGWRGPVQVETVAWGTSMQRYVRNTKLHNYECTEKIGGKVLGAAAGVGYTQHGVCSFVYSAYLHALPEEALAVKVMINMLPKLEWAVLLEAATDVGEWATAARPQPLALGPAQLRWLACEQRAPPLRAAGQATLVGQHI